MGGRKQRKNKTHDWDKKEGSVSSNYSVPARNMRKSDLGSVILGCTHNTINECLSNNLFGLPALHYSYIKNIREGLPLFLFNYSDRRLHGVFEAATHGQMNIDRYAWVADGDGYTSYPAQVRVRVRLQCHPLSENHFQPIIANNYYDNKHFYFELDNDQTNKLISLFQSSPVNNPNASSSQPATRRNNLSYPLPSPAKTIRQADNTIQPIVGTEIWAENLSQTSKLSYSSILSGNSTSTTATATSSRPTGSWSGLFKGQSAYEASSSSFSASDVSRIIPQSTWDTNWAANQSVDVYKDQRENSQLLVTTSIDIDCVENWESLLSPEANTTTNEFPFHQEYDDDPKESQSIATFTDEVECVQSWAAEPSSSSQPLDTNLDCGQCVTNEENEGDEEEKDDENESIVPLTVVEISGDLESWVVKLMQEVEVLKGSQLKQIVEVNRLEQQLAEAKLEIQWLRKRLDCLEILDHHRQGRFNLLGDPVTPKPFD